jgi:flavodoxin
MKALVVYDSFFGNTEKIAQAVARGIGAPEEVEVTRVGSQAPQQLAGVALLVVGSPTRGFRASPGTAAFLAGLPVGSLKGVRVAAFDTRMTLEVMGPVIRFFFFIKVGKFAAPSMAAALQKAGGALALPPEGFIVNASEGPLKEGELERAEAWGKSLNR